MYRIIIFFAFTLILTSCFKERIDIDFNKDENKKLVIVGWINTLDEPQMVEINRTISYLGDETFEGVSDAVVTIDDAVNSFMLEEKTTGKYYLPDNWQPRVGNTYQLKVQLDGKEYTASQKMRPCPIIQNMRYQIAEESEDSDSTKIYEAVFDFKDLEGEGDGLYAVDYLKGFASFGDTITNGGFADDEFIDGEYFEEIVVTESDRLYALGDTVMIELHSIGNETVEYLENIYSEIFRGSPFDAPPANIGTNITGGAIGFFVVGEAQIERIIIE